ncbi:hypothetical protein GLOIN_2v1770666 [Rhizophagus irregularis DAOM 181602=DAOM 197198]|uniref:Uncharacterized protein n=1 Tax=Rhizophagus irregularis (strain DAOM 181602 / DAOM 197198 / MUCL 43194) TaxID=747089 RepID=A0A2P4QBP8_RHIID|nr:hypothetical protein GLOIN_2v1770666 [Rhizophagus irregularis DAOM 181602=DAOM 197198]POG75065.1 hypothetical protein GLOIN_2v1770666 [Rhizophagus irregularis DAOM 181602=DAOM 197198]|eukprot:XP_025181931.1 hypothetical protein GLOIN_2v1770666 [Rhizophagus irregularis DAOM 181602=DAOM 197198]
MVSPPVGFSEESNMLIQNTNISPVAFLFTELYTMSTPPAPSVINPDILPPPRPDTSAPSGD